MRFQAVKNGGTLTRALITSPKLLLADEPTGALDSKSSANLMRMFKAFNEGGQRQFLWLHTVRRRQLMRVVFCLLRMAAFNQLYKGEETDRNFLSVLCPR